MNSEKPFSLKQFIRRMRALPDEIYQADRAVIAEAARLESIRNRVADLKSELLTKPDSPIDGKNDMLREAQLHEWTKAWDEPLLLQEEAFQTARVMANRLRHEFDSQGLIIQFLCSLKGDIATLIPELLEDSDDS